MQVHLDKGDLVPTTCIQFKLEGKMINNIRGRHRNPRPLPLKNFLLSYAGVRISLVFVLSFLTTDPSLFISVYKGHCQLDKGTYFSLILWPHVIGTFQGRGYKVSDLNSLCCGTWPNPPFISWRERYWVFGKSSGTNFLCWETTAESMYIYAGKQGPCLFSALKPFGMTEPYVASKTMWYV